MGLILMSQKVRFAKKNLQIPFERWSSRFFDAITSRHGERAGVHVSVLFPLIRS